eukprot:1138494-Pelagomonas_calceolata.AAC.4
MMVVTSLSAYGWRHDGMHRHLCNAIEMPSGNIMPLLGRRAQASCWAQRPACGESQLVMPGSGILSAVTHNPWCPGVICTVCHVSHWYTHRFYTELANPKHHASHAPVQMECEFLAMMHAWLRADATISPPACFTSLPCFEDGHPKGSARSWVLHQSALSCQFALQPAPAFILNRKKRRRQPASCTVCPLFTSLWCTSRICAPHSGAPHAFAPLTLAHLTHWRPKASAKFSWTCPAACSSSP